MLELLEMRLLEFRNSENEKKTDLKLIGPEFSEARIRRRGPRPCRWRCCRLRALGAERRGLWWLHPDKTCRRPVEEDPVRNSIRTSL